MNEQTASDQSCKPFTWWRWVLAGAAYGAGIFSALLAFSGSFSAQILLFLGFVILLVLACRGCAPQAQPKFTKVSLAIFLLGLLLIQALLEGFGDERVRHWKPHPAGYQAAWIFLVFAVTHLWRLLAHRHALKKTSRLV